MILNIQQLLKIAKGLSQELHKNSVNTNPGLHRQIQLIPKGHREGIKDVFIFSLNFMLTKSTTNLVTILKGTYENVLKPTIQAYKDNFIWL